MTRTPRAPTKGPSLGDRIALRILLFTAVEDPLQGLARRARVRARRGGDDGAETVEVAIAIALGVGIALALWAAYKLVVQKYLDQLP